MDSYVYNLIPAILFFGYIYIYQSNVFLKTRTTAILSVLFLVITAFDCFFILNGSNYERYISKSLLMPALIYLFYVSVGNMNRNLPKHVLLALLFSWAGDIILLFSGQLAFIGGMVAFLVAHIFYIRSFVQVSGSRIRFTLPIWFALALMAVVVATLMEILWPHLGVLRAPVLIYALTISCMFLSACNAALFVQNRMIALLLVLGACLFVVSDTCLSLNMFLYHNNSFPLIVMTTYCAAQFLLVKGFSAVITGKPQQQSLDLLLE